MEGKIFLYGNNTPPPISRLLQDFTFDLQRFTERTLTTETTEGTTTYKLTEGTTTNSYDDLASALSSAQNGDIIKLASDITTDALTAISKTLTLDLNGHTFSRKTETGNTVFYLNTSGVTFTVTDTSDGAGGSINASDTTGDRNAVSVLEGATFVLNAGNIISAPTDSKGTHVITKDSSNKDINDGTGVSLSKGGKFIMNGGSIETNGVGVFVGGSAEFTMVNGSIHSYSWFGASSNGNNDDNYSKAKMNISGGTITADESQGIYAPAIDGQTTIENATITGKTGIEIRAGSLSVSGDAKITGTGSYSSTANGNGSTSTGAGIAVAQHTTQKKIEVSVSGEAKISGEVALAVENPQKNDGSSGEIGVNITGGTFESTAQDQSVISALNADERVSINVGKATFVGALGSTFVETGNKQAAINITDNFIMNNVEYGKDGEKATLQYQEDPSDPSDLYLTGKVGWNSSPTTRNKHNYVARTDSVSGAIVFSVTGVTNAANLGADIANSVVGIPDGVTATTVDSEAAKNYKLVNLKYNVAKSDVTVSTAAANAVIDANNLLADTVKKIDARGNTVALAITGNSLDNEIYGGAGANSFTGGKGKDTIYYSAGADVFTDYKVGEDKVVLMDNSFKPSGAEIGTSGNDLVLTFGEGNSLTFAGQNSLPGSNPLSGVSIESGRKLYIYTSNTVVDYTDESADGITLGANYAPTGNTFTATNPFVTIDGSAVSVATAIEGNSNDNYIIAASVGGSLDGKGGNDTLLGGKGADTFIYASGKGVIANYGAGDSLSTSAAITSGKTVGNKLTFTIDKNNTLTFRPVDDEAISKVSLTGGGTLIEKGSLSADNLLTLFEDTKGEINAAELGATKGIDASKVTKNVVKMVGASVEGGSEYKFAENKKADVFTYGGGTVSISGYVSGSDKIDLGEYSFTGFNVSDEAVSINTAAGNIIISGVKDKEVLLHDGTRNKNNQYSSFAFAKDGVLYDKGTKPTIATILSGAGSFSVGDETTIKKIVLDASSTATVITGANVNTVIDASAASLAGDAKLTITGGTKSDKITGSRGADIFAYQGGKDVIQEFGAGDAISLGAGFELEKVTKISKSNKGVTLKFNNNNTLAINGEGAKNAITIGDTDYSFGKKSAIISADGKVVSLTSGFSGTYTVENATASRINGAAVTKNLTLKGLKNSDDYLIAGRGKKTKLQGMGGNDTLVGGTGADTFFYKKGESGNIVILNFDSDKDKLKISGSKVIDSLSTTGKFEIKMTNDASIKVDSISGADSADVGNILLKANNTYYWFEDKEFEDSSGAARQNVWVTSTSKISNSVAKNLNYSIVDLGYSTNLVKAGLAYKSDDFTVNSSGISKKTT